MPVKWAYHFPASQSLSARFLGLRPSTERGITMSAERETNTRDIGLAIAQYFEGATITHWEEDDEGDLSQTTGPEVSHIDASDYNNLKVFLTNNQVFTIRIFGSSR